MISPETFVRIASTYYPVVRNEEVRNFASLFGVSPALCSKLWTMLDPLHNLPEGSRPCYLLWALILLKVYATEAIHCSIVGGVDRKTFRKWSWIFVEAISYFESEVVSIFMVQFDQPFYTSYMFVL